MKPSTYRLPTARFARRVLLIAFLCFSVCSPLFSQTPSEQVARQYQWIGQGDDSNWSTESNWQVLQGDDWSAAASPPGPSDIVLLGDGADDRPHTIQLTRDIAVGSLIMSATGKRQYTIASQPYAPDPEADQSFTLRFTNRDAIQQAESTTQNLHLQVPVVGHHERGLIFQLGSHHDAQIVVERPLSALGHPQGEGRLNLTSEEGARGGILELRAPIFAERFVQAAGTTLLLNGKPDVPMLNLSRIFYAHGGTLLFANDAVLGSGISPRGHTVYVRPDTTRSEPIHVNAHYIARGGAVHIEQNPSQPNAKMRVFVNSIDSGGSSQPTAVHLDEGMSLDLGGNQAGPTLANAAEGIHGKGSLIKSRTRRDDRRAEHISLIAGRNTYTGGTYIGKGQLRLVAATIPVNEQSDARSVLVEGQIGPGMLFIANASHFDMNGIDQTVAGLGDMQHELNWPPADVQLGGAKLTLDVTSNTTFAGQIEGAGALIKKGSAAQAFSAGFVLPRDCQLTIEDGAVQVKDTMNLEAGRFELVGGRVRADHLQAAGQTWRVTLGEQYESKPAVVARTVDIKGSALELSLATGYTPDVGTRLTLLQVEQPSNAVMFGIKPESVLQVGDRHFRCVLEKTETAVAIQLVVVPE